MKALHRINRTLALLGACLLSACQPQEQETTPPVAEAQTLQFETQTLRRTSGDCRPDSAACAHISIVYPVATAGPAALRQGMNRYVQQRLRRLRLDFGPDTDTSSAAGADAADALADLFFRERQDFIESTRKMQDPPPPVIYGWEMQVEGEPIFVAAQAVSLRFDSYSYIGGAHGNPHRVLQSFDSTGHALTLPDMVRDTLALQQLVEQEFRRVRHEMVGDRPLSEAGLFIHGNTLPLPQNYALTADGLLLYYNPYEIGPYAMGGTELLLPYHTLGQVLQPVYRPQPLPKP